MENNNSNYTDQKPVVTKRTNVFVSEDGDIKQGLETAVPQNSAQKVAKERAYFDAEQNPARQYNVNDQAFSQSSPENFIKTKSNFHQGCTEK